MSDRIPAVALNYLSNLIVNRQSLAYLLVAKDGCLLSWGGNLSNYEISNLQKGELASKQVPLLEGLLPLNGVPVVLPCTNVEQGICADVHIFSGNEGDWILLLDASKERDRHQLMQQKGNDLSLLRNEQSKIINQYFGKEIKDNLAQGLIDLNEQGKRRDITILSTKICEFTAYSEHNSPKKTFKTLNLYLSPIIQSILDEAGMIDKIVGDTVISLFGILPSIGCPPMQAIAAAFQMLESVQEINQRQQSNPNLDIAISITSGLVVLGLIGSKASKTCVTVGHPIDLLLVLKSQVNSKEILIDEHTYNKINDMQKHFLESVSVSTTSGIVKTYSCRTK
ncbi:MAG: adenylate/guanylate cyclase domain-containing protein [Chroococcus sp. CMT-3BRIN-NPC107]|jgi:class 3 adenylate cyclase|nr:adenylate/guanylate cyclase domain-containing protein [Chroococcus sp. CMT-3BRIN-NPC107]